MWRNKVKRTYDNLKESIRCYVYGWIREQKAGNRKEDVLNNNTDSQ